MRRLALAVALLVAFIGAAPVLGAQQRSDTLPPSAERAAERIRAEQREQNEVREKAHANGHEQEGHKTSGFFHGWKLWIIRRAPPSLVVQSVRLVA